MESQPAENFFEVKLSPEGMERISRLFKTSKWIIGVCLVFCSVFISLTTARTIYYLRLPGEQSLLVKNQLFLAPIYTAISIVLLIAIWGSFFYFCRACKRSILAHNSGEFNRSFKWLQRVAILVIALMLWEIAMGMYYAWELYYLWSFIPAS